LTLRTLLAYLDDTLEPAQTKLIGQKVAESEVAQQLIERIKQVTRRRRLTAPPASGPGSLDANSVAEYLDNVLSGDRLGEVEELLLHSDVHLAEVAACHQILTLFLGQPASIPPTAAKRMYGLIKGRQNRPFRKAVSVPDEDLDEDLGERRPGQLVRRLAPIAGILALLVLLGFAISQILPGRSKDKDTAQIAQGDTSPAGPELIAAPKLLPETKTETTPPDKEAKQTTPADKIPIDKVPADKPSAERRPVGKYLVAAMAPPSVLLDQPAGKDTWQRAKAGAPVSSADTLVSLPGYRSELQLDTGLRLVLWGNVPQYSAIPVFESSVTLHVPEEGFDVDFTLHRGRVVLVNIKQAGPLRVKVRFQDEIWQLTLRDTDTIVGLERLGGYRPGVPFSRKPGGEPPITTVGMYGLEGVTDVKIRYAKFELGAPTFYVWQSTGAVQRGPQKQQALPPWFTEPVPNTAHAKEMTLALDELSKRLGANKPVNVALAEALQGARGTSLDLTILCLGAVDELSQLLGLLADDRPEVRWASLYTLTQWTGRSADNDLKLFDALQKSGYSAVEAQTVMDLMHNFSEDDASKPETYEVLIDYLRHQKLVVREMAWRTLVGLWPEGRKIPYNAAGPAEMRNAAYEKWKEKIPAGKLPPRGPAGGGPKS
jgi:hypothetical protein